MFLILCGWFIIVSIGVMVGFVFNKLIIDKKLLKMFNAVLSVILVTITIYFVVTMKNLL